MSSAYTRNGNVRRAWFGFVSCVAVVLAVTPGVARAQNVQNSGSPSTDVDIALVGNVSSSIMLTIVGTGQTQLANATQTSVGVPAQATVDFGTFTTLKPSTANTEAWRTTGGTAGAIVAARLIATITYQGVLTGAITVSRQLTSGTNPGDVPAGNLLVASPALASWSSAAAGAVVPEPSATPFNLCTATGAPACQSGTPYEHHIAVFIPDTQVAGVFSTVVVYTAVAP